MSAGSVQDPQFTDNISVASNRPCFLRLQRHSSARFSCRLIHSKRQMQGKCGWSTLEITSYGLWTLWGMGPGDSCRDFPWALPCRHPSCHPPVIPWEPVAVVLNLQPTRPIPSATDDSFPADFETSVYWLYRIRRLLHSLQLMRCQDVQTGQRNPYWIL
ncbi:hypothetical protein BGW80DRAFT_1292202 [Lactifluus volemus]|nr:hypothetical protein BGW80DRAFT_1292202 [Lactifluus volemus]